MPPEQKRDFRTGTENMQRGFFLKKRLLDIHGSHKTSPAFALALHARLNMLGQLFDAVSLL